MALDVRIYGNNLQHMVALTQTLRSVSRAITIVEAARPLNELLAEPDPPPQAAIVYLTGPENVGDIRLAFRNFPATTFVFIARSSPPRSSVAHAVRQSGGYMLSSAQPAVVIAATLVAALAQSAGAA